MTYAFSPALQSAVYAELVADPGLTAILGTDIYDALPPGVLPSIYALIGPETVWDRSDMTGRGAEHDFTVLIVTDGAGFATAKSGGGRGVRRPERCRAWPEPGQAGRPALCQGDRRAARQR